MRSLAPILAAALLVPDGTRAESPAAFPARVHVFEDFETTIEQRWWLRGTPESRNLAPALASIPNTRALRAAESKDFDDKMGDPAKDYKAVVFNPVPGPPMGANTRLSFRYWLNGTDTLRVQIYSLTNNYHRRLLLEGLPTGEWQSADVDMTLARRPDGSGGPLSTDERIDDIQFYIDPGAELIIDDIVLYEAAAPDEKRPLPRRIVFTGSFDTGEQGNEWPGDFEIVPHEKPFTWDAARAVPDASGDAPWLRVGLRGARPLGSRYAISLRYRLSMPGPLRLVIAERNDKGAETIAEKVLADPVTGAWADMRAEFTSGAADSLATEIRLHAPPGAELLVDDLLLFEPGNDG